MGAGRETPLAEFMKTNIFIFMLIVACGYGIMVAADHFLKPPPVGADGTTRGQVGEEAPQFAFQTLEGDYVSLTDLRGKIILLNFWASWCAPCRKEFPDLLRAASKNDDVILLALSSDIEKEAAQAFITSLRKEKHLPTRLKNAYIGIDPGQKITSSLYQTYKLPETLIIDKDLKIREKLIGAAWTPQQLDAIIRRLR
jgi:thiol-disulfide isomerase/thioredoxin